MADWSHREYKKNVLFGIKSLIKSIMFETIVLDFADIGGWQIHKNFNFNLLKNKSMNKNSKFDLLKR